MKAGKWDFTLQEGDDWSAVVRLNTGTAPNGGQAVKSYNAIDITGYTAKMQMRTRVGGAVILELSTENEKIIVDTVNKKFLFKLGKAETIGLKFIRMFHQVKFVSADGTTTRKLEGIVTYKKMIVD